jgi:glyoxylase-like metal-dependent hydrolase (beta-lactamase superfamily II)
MRRMEIIFGAAALVTAILAASSASAEPAAEVSLTRLDCGQTVTLADRGLSGFTDVAAFSGLKVQLTFSCYLIKHGADYMVWDTGNPVTAAGATAAPTAPKTSIVDQLKQLSLKPEQIKFVGISHYHGDQARLERQSGEFRPLDQRRREGRAGIRRPGCVRRRYRRDVEHARTYTGPSQSAGKTSEHG